MRGLSDAEVLRLALSGGRAALPALVDRWTPIIQARVVQVLRRHAAAAGDRAFQEVESFVQQAFVALFEDEAAALRAWKPSGGLSLDNWVGLLAEQQVLASVRTKKRSPFTEDPAPAEDLDSSSSAPNPERVALGRDLLERLLERLQESLSPLGWRLFCLLYLEQASVEDVSRRSGLSTAAVYGWRSRLRRLSRELRDTLSEIRSGSHRPLGSAP